MKTLFIFLFIQAIQAQTIRIECSTPSVGGSTCESLSTSASTVTGDWLGLGRIAKISSLNVTNTPVEIANRLNTQPLTLFALINNRGRAQDLSLDLESHYQRSSALSFITTAPKASSALIVADTVNNLYIDVSGHFGQRGRNLSELCRDQIQNGYFGSLYPLANQALKNDVPSSPCTNETLVKIGLNQPNFGCPEGYHYLPDRDNQSQPELQDEERPKRIPYLKRCVETQVFRTCRIGEILYPETNLECDDYYQNLVNEGILPGELSVLEVTTVVKDVTTYEEGIDQACSGSSHFTGFTQDYPYQDLIEAPVGTGSISLESVNCRFGYCPGASDYYSFGTLFGQTLTLEPGESGSYGGRADLFAYDVIGTQTLKFQNGQNGENGIADLELLNVKRYCVKVNDATNASDLPTLQNPIVSFYRMDYYPVFFDLPALIPSTPYPQRNVTEAVGIYKHVDSSVRNFIVDEYVNTKFP